MLKEPRPSVEEPPEDGEHLATILSCVAEGVFTVGRDKRIQFFNHAAEQITGFSAKDAVGQLCRDIFRTEVCDRSCVLEEVERTQRTVTNRPVRILDRNGRSVLVSVSAAALRNRAGEIIGGVETFRDLTTEEELRRKIEKSYTFQDIVSRHPAMHELFAILPDVAESNFPVLLEGESGTGKELFARALHDLSTRKRKRFVAVNCGALPDTLLESELFGYKKGAFTDAKSDKPGRFDMARGGTLFLDEIGDVSPALQVRFLRVLQEKTYQPLGGTVPVQADVRIVAASNQGLLQKVRSGEFREDLYYRLNVLRMDLPPLRERQCDIPLLLEHFRKRLNAETGKSIEAIDQDVVRLLMDYPFPGNIRELENVMQHAFVMCKEAVIQVLHLPAGVRASVQARTPETTPTLKQIEQRAIEEALLSNNGSRTATAKQLGIDPSTLYRKMRRYDIA